MIQIRIQYFFIHKIFHRYYIAISRNVVTVQPSDVRAEYPFTETIWEITVLDTKTSPTKNCHHFSLDFPQKTVKNKLIFSVKVY